MNTHMTDEQRDLVTENINLVYYFMNKHSGYYQLIDDFLGVCSEAFCKAAMYYDKDTKYKFSTLANTFMLTATRNAYRSQKGETESILSLDYEPTESDITLGDYLIDIDTSSMINYSMLQWDIEKIIDTFTNRQQEIIRYYLTYNDTQVEVGRYFNISRERVRQIINAFVTKCNALLRNS